LSFELTICKHFHGGDADQPRTGVPVFGWRSIGRAMDIAFD